MFSVSECLVENEDNEWDGTLANAHLENIVGCFWGNVCLNYADEGVDCEALLEKQFSNVFKSAAKSSFRSSPD